MAHLLPRCPTTSPRRLFYSSPSWPLPIRSQNLPPSLQSRRPYQSLQSVKPRHRPTTTPRPCPQFSYTIPRSYHSKHHPLPPHEYSNSQTTILSAALHHIPEHGFTRESLTLGARDVGFLDVSIQLFPRGELDLIFFWLASRRGLLRGKVEDGLFENPTPDSTGKLKKGNELSVEEKVKVLLLERLRMNAGIKHQWQDVSASD